MHVSHRLFPAVWTPTALAPKTPPPPDSTEFAAVAAIAEDLADGRDRLRSMRSRQARRARPRSESPVAASVAYSSGSARWSPGFCTTFDLTTIGAEPDDAPPGDLKDASKPAAPEASDVPQPSAVSQRCDVPQPSDVPDDELSLDELLARIVAAG